MAGACRVFSPWGNNIHFSHSTQRRGLFFPRAPLISLPALGLTPLPTPPPPPRRVHTAVALVQRMPHTFENSYLQLLRLFAKQRLTFSVFLVPQFVVWKRSFSCPNTMAQSTASIFLPFVCPQKGIPPLCTHAVLSLPIHIHTCLSHQAVSLHLCRFFSHSADRFPGCSKCSDPKTAVFKQVQTRTSEVLVPLLLHHLNS